MAVDDRMKTQKRPQEPDERERRAEHEQRRKQAERKPVGEVQEWRGAGVCGDRHTD